MSAASEMGIIQRDFDWRNCIAAPTSSSISFATSHSVSSFDHFSHTCWLDPISPVSFCVVMAKMISQKKT